MSAIRIIGAVPTTRSAISADAQVNSSSVHGIPAKIKHDGPAKVDTYFVVEDLAPETNSSISKEYRPTKEAAFRGRRLQGHEVDLQEKGIIGLVFADASSATEAEMLPGCSDGSDGAADAGASASSSGASSSAAAPAAVVTAAGKKTGATAAAAKKRGYGGGGGGGFGGGGHYGDEDEDEDDDDDDEDMFDVDFGDNDDDEEESGASAAAAAASARGGASGMAANTPSSFGRCQMRTWTVDRAFTKATYWLHDKAASELDQMRAACDWFETAKRLHGTPVSKQELAEAEQLMAAVTASTGGDGGSKGSDRS